MKPVKSTMLALQTISTPIPTRMRREVNSYPTFPRTAQQIAPRCKTSSLHSLPFIQTRSKPSRIAFQEVNTQHPFYSVRIGRYYRALCLRETDDGIIWV